MITVQYIDIEKLISHEQNPRKIDDTQFTILKDSLVKNADYFEVRPILCNSQFVVFAGNMRLRAATEIGMKQVPVAILDVTPERERELMIRDNVQNGVYDYEMLGANYDPAELVSWGITEKELGLGIDGLGTSFGLPSGEKGNMQQITFTLAKEQAQFINEALERYHAGENEETFENTNKNGNAIYSIVKQWAEPKT